MKSTIIRGFVLFLALTGFGASKIATAASASTSFKANVNMMGGTPTPLCPPSSGQFCGMD